MTAEPSAARTYRELRRARVLALLGQWVSEIEPIWFWRVDVSPQVLGEVGIAADGASAPQLVTRITVDDMVEAGAIV